ncbi:MAG: 50S ribosomal protein L6 [Clostridia bacterium]|nr:50S ribosomal protein L6 [Clostridia bacterium]
MSRIGKQPVVVPAGVTVALSEGNVLEVKGPKGSLKNTFHPTMIIKVEGNAITVARPSDDKFERSLHGLTRSMIQNMVDGVTNGFKKQLEINGVGYRALLQGKTLVLHLGYSHTIEMTPPEGVSVEVPNANQIIVSGSDKQMVGEFAAKVRSKRPPEPYKGKGIKYSDEHVRRKEGKTGAGKK